MARGSAANPEKATIFDVAKTAQVSIKTVSRVVNNEPNVRAATRDKVMRAVEQLNYRPNAAARGLSGKRSYAVGLIYENPEEFSYVGQILNGALAACEAAGYSLLLRPLTLPDPEVGRRVREFAEQASVDGIILLAPLGDMDAVRDVLRELGLPFAAISPKQPAADAINIYCEDEQASFELTEYVIGQGHTAIGFIKGHPDHDATAKRFAGYRRALKEHGIAFRANLVRQGYFDFASGRKCAGKLLDLEQRPSVIIASNDDMAAGVMFEARERHLEIPADISVAGFDDSPLATHLWPTLTTVRQPILHMAESATQQLIAGLGGRRVETDAGQHFRCELKVRGSTISVK